MGYIPEHGGIEEIIRTKQFPKCFVGDEYVEALDTVVTGYKHKQRLMNELNAEEVGDRVHGGRREYTKLKGTLTYHMEGLEVPQSKKTKGK